MFGANQPAAKTPPSVHELDRAIQAGIIQTRIFSGAAAACSKQGALFHRNVYGTCAFDPPPKKVSFDTCWDLGALTKPLATSLGMLWLVSKGRLSMDSPVSRLLKDFQGPHWDKILVEHLLDHTSGLPGRIPIHETLKAEAEKNPTVKLVGTREAEQRAREMIAKTLPQKGPGEISLYSELGYLILGWIIEAMTHKRLDVFMVQEIYKPLGLNNLFFIDLSDAKSPHAKRPYMAMENCPWRKRTIIGQVHDSDAYAVGGVAGHAGLFGTLDDVHRLAQMLLDSHLGKANASFHPGTVRRFLKRSQRPCNRTWALGWDTPPPKEAMAGQRMSRNSVGHLSLIGHALWLDLQNEVVTVTLTNRVHPTTEGKDAFMAKFRPHLEDLYSAYAKQWQPPPPEDVEIDDYALVREREMKKKKMQATTAKSLTPPVGASTKKNPASSPK